MDINIKCRILRDVARGMKYLHDDVNLVHRDLKPSNIMIDSNFRARIGDFNLSVILQKNSADLPMAAGTLPYMAPELIENWKKAEQLEGLDLKMCDVYSFGILVNEVIFQKKTFEKITEENCLQLKVTQKEKPEIPSTEDKNLLSVLMRSCWSDDPPSRLSFSKLLDPKDGLLLRIKKNMTEVSASSEIIRTKLNKKYKEGIEYIDFKTFWKKFEDVFGKEETDKAVSFFKILLNINDNQNKVYKKDAMRICDWVSGSDNKWISEGFKNSFFFNYYWGEKSVEKIDLDDTFQDKDKEKLLAILHWDPIKNSFFASVRNQTQGTWDHLCLKTKTIAFNDLEKDAKAAVNRSYKDLNVHWVPSTLFDRLRTGASNSSVYTLASSDRIASIYVS